MGALTVIDPNRRLTGMDGVGVRVRAKVRVRVRVRLRAGLE